MEAALELVSCVIDKQMLSSRDTLAMPILYNGRHALELLLKFTVNKLFEMDIIQSRHRPDHDILSHWSLLQGSQIGDRVAKELIAQLEPYVVSLSKIDDDGQELRFAKNRSGDKSLDKLSIINLKVIQNSLRVMNEIMMNLKYRILAIQDERMTNSYTRECSRRDLEDIARMLGEHAKWREARFDDTKRKVMEQYGLSGRKFSQAVDKIRDSRPLAAMIGLESSLTYLSDEKLISVVTRWRDTEAGHPDRDTELGTDYLDLDRLDMQDSMKKKRRAVESLKEDITLEEFAELEVLYYVGRNCEFGEVYDDYLNETVDKYGKSPAVDGDMYHILSKTNLEECIVKGCLAVGRPSLAAQLEAESSVESEL